MPRRDGDVFLLGTAISVSSRGFVGGIARGTRTAQRPKNANRDADQGRAYRGWACAKLGSVAAEAGENQLKILNFRSSNAVTSETPPWRYRSRRGGARRGRDCGRFA